MSNAAQYPPADHEHVPDCDDYAYSGAGFHPTCERICICRQVARVEHRVIGEAVQRVEAIEYDPDSGVDWNWDYDIDPTGMTRNPLVWIREAVAAIKNEAQ